MERNENLEEQIKILEKTLEDESLKYEEEKQQRNDLENEVEQQLRKVQAMTDYIIAEEGESAASMPAANIGFADKPLDSMKIFCPKCGFHVGDGIFCSRCGTKVK